MQWPSPLAPPVYILGLAVWPFGRLAVWPFGRGAAAEQQQQQQFLSFLIAHKMALTTFIITPIAVSNCDTSIVSSPQSSQFVVQCLCPISSV